MLLQLDNDHTNICRPSHWLGSFQLTRRNNLIGRLVGSQEHNREEVQVSTNRTGTVCHDIRKIRGNKMMPDATLIMTMIL